MDLSDTEDQSKQQPSASVRTSEERYIHAINTEVFGNEAVRETLWAVQSLANAVETRYITKQQVAEEVGMSIQDLYNTSALEILERFGIVELLQKVHRANETYVLIDEKFCGWLDSAPDYGPSDPPGGDKFPHTRNKVERYGKSLDAADDVTSGTDDEPTPTEVNFELVAEELGVKPPISASVSIERAKMKPGGSTIQWRFELEGYVEGNFEEVDENKMKNRFQREVFKRTIGSLLNHRVKCTCETVREHLINVAGGTADFVAEDDWYAEILDDQGLIQFGIIITKIVRDSND